MDRSIVCPADFDAIPQLFRDEEGALQLNKTSDKITKRQSSWKLHPAGLAGTYFKNGSSQAPTTCNHHGTPTSQPFEIQSFHRLVWRVRTVKCLEC
jgi:hypothetical protein